VNDKEFIEQVRDRAGMFGLNGSYYPTAMFLQGFDIARCGGLLRGFTEWLVVRKGECSSFNWLASVFDEALPGVGVRHLKNGLTPDQDQQAVDHLFSLVLEFLDVRDDPRQLARMYARYEALYAQTIG